MKYPPRSILLRAPKCFPTTRFLDFDSGVILLPFPFAEIYFLLGIILNVLKVWSILIISENSFEFRALNILLQIASTSRAL